MSAINCQLSTINYQMSNIEWNIITRTASLLVPVSVVKSVLFPTLGNPTKPIRVSPLLFTSKPRSAFFVPELLPPNLL